MRSARLPAAPALAAIRTDRLGETLLVLPALAAWKSRYPSGRTTLVVSDRIAELFDGAPGVDQLWSVSVDEAAPWWRQALPLARRLRRGAFDAAIVFHPVKAWHAAVWLAGIPIRAGYNRKWPWLLSVRLPDRSALGGRHAVQANLDMVGALGVAAPDPAPVPRLKIGAADAQAVDRLLRERDAERTTRSWIAVHPWASHPSKLWPRERFQALVSSLGAWGGASCRVAVIGGAEHSADAADFCRAAPSALNLVGALSLRQLAAFFARCRAVVSNDSGPAHVAAAVGTPTVVLFGTADPARDPRRWGPWGPGHAVIWQPTLEAITVEDVIEATKTLLRHTAHSTQHTAHSSEQAGLA